MQKKYEIQDPGFMKSQIMLNKSVKSTYLLSMTALNPQIRGV